MAGKRHFGSMDHVMHNKLARLELASQRSAACFGLASAQDLQTCQNFMAYSMPNTDGHGSFNPWSTTAAYMQYTDSVQNEHLQTREASVKHQRPHVERPHNPLQLSDNSSNQVPVHHSSPVRGYHMACPRACPSIAMPRPVYRSQSNFMDAAYGTRGFQSLSSQPLCPPAVEWTSARFAQPSSPLHDSGTKKHFSTPTTYPEVAGSPSSMSQGLQEQNYVYRHRADTSRSVGVSSAYPQKDIFTDAHHSVAQQNVHLLYAESNVPLGRQRSSAFTTPSPKHSNNKPSAYQGSLDHRLGNSYSKNFNSNATDSIHHRSTELSCSTDLRESPQSLRGSSIYPQRENRMHSGYVNSELRSQTPHHDRTLQPSERPFQGNPSTHKTITDIPVCSGQMNRYVCVMSSRADKPQFDSSPTNRSLQERSAYQEQSAHASFDQQGSSSSATPIVSSHEFISGHHASRHSIALETSSLYSSIHAFEDRRVTGTQTVENTTESHSSVSNVHLKHAESTVPRPSVSRVDSQYQMNHNNVRSRYDAATLLPPNCELSGSNMVDIADPKSASISEDVCFDNPKSPPMPVINDVFSLAPYRAYLEGKAPHPFATNQESEVENIAFASAFLEAPLTEGRTEKLEGNSGIASVVNDENVEKNRNKETVQTGEDVVSMQNTDVEFGVLDLSLKKLPQTGSSSCGQPDSSCQDKGTLHTIAAENCLGKAEKQIQGTESKMFSDTSQMYTFDQKSFSSQASSKMLESSENNCSPVSYDRLSSGQEKRLSSEKLICQRQKNISQSPKTFSWQVQEYCQSVATETQKNNAQENSMSLAHKRSSNRNQEVGHPQDTKRLPSQNQNNPPSQMTECLTHQLEKNHLSQVFKSSSHNIQGSGKSHSNKGLPHQPQDKCSSKNFRQQDLSSQTLQTLPAHTLVQHPSHSNFSVFVNTMQTQTTIVPVMLASPTIYFTNSIALHTSQPPSIKRPVQNSRKPLESSQSLSSPSGSENESNGFHSSKSFMFRKYKMKKLSSSEEEPCRASTDSVSQNVSNPFPSDTVQSLPPSAPESSPALGEANVSLASVNEPSRSSSGHQFSELHRSVHRAITSSVARSHFSLLEDWLSKTKEEEMSKMPGKNKNNFRSNDPSSDLPGEDIWLAFDGVRLRLHKLLSQLETFMFTRKCPFPHVIRAGAIFIPIHLVKEVLFPELPGPAVDRVLQKHKVELRPTTLSEEKLLRETKLKDCPSRMLKLLALKQLPDIYPDLLCHFCRHTIQQELGKRSRSLEKEELKLSDSSKKEPLGASPRKFKSALILKLQRVRKHSGIHVYKTQKPKTPQKKDMLQKSPVCHKKQYRARQVLNYTKRRRRRTSKSFPNLVGRRILHLFDDGDQEVWFPGRVLRVHQRSRNPRDTQYEVWYDGEPGTRYFLELLQDYEKGWLQLDG
ncbi:uncharacterized protein C15orf39 homolog isoform X1 [Bufo gargarizans]|uniref:uncharacterized protein C15orf39 homolog isoform X1 n=1 Tax=Bufo gargarizans TaxID=30331 RepID=UPI001CF26DB1|nr:uncharacterized protein C15orf39 homolog isoform X1 [Bufo gargarizans]